MAYRSPQRCHNSVIFPASCEKIHQFTWPFICGCLKGRHRERSDKRWPKRIIPTPRNCLRPPSENKDFPICRQEPVGGQEAFDRRRLYRVARRRNRGGGRSVLRIGPVSQPSGIPFAMVCFSVRSWDPMTAGLRGVQGRFHVPRPGTQDWRAHRVSASVLRFPVHSGCVFDRAAIGPRLCDANLFSRFYLV